MTKSLEDQLEQWFEKIAPQERLVRYGEVFEAFGAREDESKKLVMAALRRLDRRRHKKNLPLFSVLIKYNGAPPIALVRLLEQLGLVSKNTPDEQLKRVIKELRRMTWNYYTPDDRLPIPFSW